MPVTIKNYFKPQTGPVPKPLEDEKENEPPVKTKQPKSVKKQNPETSSDTTKKPTSTNTAKPANNDIINLDTIEEPVSPAPNPVSEEPTTPNTKKVTSKSNATSPNHNQTSPNPTSPNPTSPNPTSPNPTTPNATTPNGTKKKRTHKKLTEEEKEERRIEKEKKAADKILKDAADKKVKDEKKEADRLDREAKKEAKKEAEKIAKAAKAEAEKIAKEAKKVEKEKQDKIDKEKRESDRKAKLETRLEREAKKDAEKRAKDAEKKAAEEKKISEKKLEEEKAKQRAEKMKAKRWGNFIKKPEQILKKEVEIVEHPFRLNFQKRKFHIHPSESYSECVKSIFSRDGIQQFTLKTQAENSDSMVDENSNYLSELTSRPKIKVISSGQKLRIIERNTDAELICLEDDHQLPTHARNFYKYKTCKRFWHGTSIRFRNSDGVDLHKIGRTPCKKQNHVLLNNEVRIDYEYDSELEWENEPSDAESCCTLSDSGGDEDLGDDKFEENDEFCVPHGYLSDDEEGHDQMKADKNLNYKKKKIRVLVPRVMVYESCVENNGMDTDAEIADKKVSQRESVTSRDLAKNLQKIGMAISSEKTTLLKPTITIASKSKHLKEIEDLRTALAATRIGNRPGKKVRVQETKKSVSFPCMQELCQLLHCNPLSKDTIVEEFHMFLMKTRYENSIPGYILPTNAQIKKRITKIAVYAVKDKTGLSKLKCWQVKQCVLDRFYGEEKYAESWKFYFPAHEDKFTEFINKEKRMIEKRLKTAANKAERERKRLAKEDEKKLKEQQNAKEELLPLNQLKSQTQKSSQVQKPQKSQKSSQAKKPHQTQKQAQHLPIDQTEKRKNSENAIPAPKRVKLCELGPEELMTDQNVSDSVNNINLNHNPEIVNSPNVDRTGNLLKFMKIQSKEERAKTIKNCPESLLPEVKPELKFISSSRPISPNSGSNMPEEEKKFGLPTQAGINKLFNMATHGNDTHDKNADGKDLTK